MSDRMVRVIKELPTASDVHVDSLLTNFSAGFALDQDTDLVSSIFPRVKVNHQTSKYTVYPKADFFRNEARIRAPGTPVPRGGFRQSTDNYYCDVYNWGTQINEETRANADNPALLDQMKVKYVTKVLGLKRDVDFVSQFMIPGIWGTSIVGVTSGAVAGTSVLGWNISGSTPIEDMQAAIRRVLILTGVKPNTIVLGYDVRNTLDVHAQLIARLVNGQTPGQAAEVTDADLARLFKVQRVITANSVYNAAKEGLAADMQFVAGDFVWVGYVDPSPGLESMTAGVQFVWTGLRLGSDEGTRINRWYDNEIYAEKIDGFANWDNKVVSAEAGYFFSNIIA